jgi:hypothetical protein
VGKVGEETAGRADAGLAQAQPDAGAYAGVSPWLARISLSLLAAPLLAARQALAASSGGRGLSRRSRRSIRLRIDFARFRLVALAALSSELTAGLLRLRNAPFPKARRRIWALLPGAVDLALAACASLAIEGDWLHRLFPPLVLLGPCTPAGSWSGRIGRPCSADRGLLAAVLAVAAVFGSTEPPSCLRHCWRSRSTSRNSRVKRG